MSDDDESDDNIIIHDLAKDTTDDEEDDEEEPVSPKAKKGLKTQRPALNNRTRRRVQPSRRRKVAKPPARTPPTTKPKGKTKKVQHEIQGSDDETASESVTARKWSKAESDKRDKMIDANVARAGKRDLAFLPGML